MPTWFPHGAQHKNMFVRGVGIKSGAVGHLPLVHDDENAPDTEPFDDDPDAPTTKTPGAGDAGRTAGGDVGGKRGGGEPTGRGAGRDQARTGYGDGTQRTMDEPAPNDN